MCRFSILAIHRPVDEPSFANILYTATYGKTYPVDIDMLVLWVCVSWWLIA
jgi:hypothetical protein